MHAKDIYEHFDQAGLTPPVHYHAAPGEWRNAAQALATRIGDHEDQVEELRAVIREQDHEIGILEGAIEEKDEEIEELEKRIKELQK